MGKSSLQISIVLVLGLIAVLLEVPTGGVSESSYELRGPIRILGNGDFSRANGVLYGSGTEANPYIIEALEIDATDHEYGIYIENTTAYFIIRDCKIHGANRVQGEERWQGNGIYFYNVRNGRIQNCEISGNQNRGIALYNSLDNTISGNVIANNNRGIYLEDAPNNTISGNTVELNMRFGIYLVRSSEVTVAQNTVNNSKYGIRIYASSRDAVSGNTLTDNEIGLLLDKSSLSTLSNNMIARNTEAGVSLWRSTSNEIYGNAIQNGAIYGIKAWGGSVQNVIYHNNLIGNHRNAWDEGVNSWDNGSQGNFWDDYTGTDADGDGIGEVSYPIPGGDNQNRDRYPLMEPWGRAEASK